MKKKLGIIFAVILLSACSTVQTAKTAKGTGDKQLFTASKNVLWPAMISAVKSTGGSIKEKDQNSCHILASYGASAWSWGEKVAVFCTPKESGTEVEVVMKASYKLNVTAVKRAGSIFSHIRSEITSK